MNLTETAPTISCSLLLWNPVSLSHASLGAGEDRGLRLLAWRLGDLGDHFYLIIIGDLTLAAFSTFSSKHAAGS